MQARASFVLMMLLAGCITPFSAPLSASETPETRTSYFHSAMTLAASPEDNMSVVRTGGFYESWAAGDDYPTWVADPMGHDVRITTATVTLYLQVSGPVVESERFPDIMVYGGSGEAWMGFGSRTDLLAFQPDQVYKVEVELTMPVGGLWLPPAEGFGLKIVPVMLQQDDRADIEILLGGNDTASQVAWTFEELELPEATPERGETTGDVTGTIYVGPAAPPTTSQRTPLPLGDDTAWVVAWMNTTENVGIPDIDLSIVSPNGTTLATSGTPTPQEAIRVSQENLAGAGEYGLVVTTAGSPRASFKIEWFVGRSP
jgi:hypothetical protein